MGDDEDDQFPAREDFDDYGRDAFDGGDIGYESDEDDVPAPAATEEPMLTVHHFQPTLARWERGLKVLYKEAASLFSKFDDPDVNSKLYRTLLVIAVCIELRLPWPLAAADMDATFKGAMARAKPQFVADRADDILDRIADELVAIGCGIETLVMLNVRLKGVPARFGNLAAGDLARHLTELGWETFGILPGYVERKDRQEPK